jgi:hypothetical protein
MRFFSHNILQILNERPISVVVGHFESMLMKEQERKQERVAEFPFMESRGKKLDSHYFLEVL